MTEAEQLGEALDILSTLRDGSMSEEMAARTDRLLNGEWEDQDEAVGPEPVRNYTVRIGRDATAYYTAAVKGTLSEIKGYVSRHGYGGPTETPWMDGGVTAFDEVEEVKIYDPVTSEEVTSWEPEQAWTDEQ